MNRRVFHDPSLSSENLNWYLQEISRIPTISPDREKELAYLAQAGDENALRQLVEANLRFVVSFAKRYRGMGLSFLDLLNEGNIGLIEAARRFKPEKNVKFITYAVWWIRQSIIHALTEQVGTFRLPQKQAHLAYRIGKKTQKLAQALARAPSTEELAEELDISQEEVRQLLSAVSGSVSLSGEGSGDDQDFALVDRLEQADSVSADEHLLQETLEQQVRDLLADLNEKEAFVIRQRYGLTGDDPKTLREIGLVLNVSRERVRQIESLALKKLRRNSSIQELHGFLT